MKVKRMALSEVKDNLSRIVQEVGAREAVIIITRHGRDAARMTAVDADSSTEPGTHRQRLKAYPYRKLSRQSDTADTAMHGGTHSSRATTWETLSDLAERIREDLPEGITAGDITNDIRS